MSNWIPTSEKLPSENERVLVSVHLPHRQAVRSGTYYNKLFSNDNGDCWSADDEEIKAWMPLPEPYEDKEHE